MNSPHGPVVHQANDYPLLNAFGDTYQFHLTGKDTGGKLTVFTGVTPPGGGPPPHVHANEDEWFVVIEGRVAFWANDTWTEVGPGGSAFLPRGIPHTFKNVGDVPSKVFVQTSPAGMEDFLAEAAVEFSRPEGPDMGRAAGIAAKYGISFV